jgi:hypothetical protein
MEHFVTNSVKEIKDFFSTPEKPVNTTEMMQFWKSLSDDEKAYYQAADLG